MGELAPNSNELPNSGPLHRSPRRQNAHETTGNFVWGKTGMETTATFSSSLIICRQDPNCPILILLIAYNVIYVYIYTCI